MSCENHPLYCVGVSFPESSLVIFYIFHPVNKPHEYLSDYQVVFHCKSLIVFLCAKTSLLHWITCPINKHVRLHPAAGDTQERPQIRISVLLDIVPSKHTPSWCSWNIC